MCLDQLLQLREVKLSTEHVHAQFYSQKSFLFGQEGKPHPKYPYTEGEEVPFFIPATQDTYRNGDKKLMSFITKQFISKPFSMFS